jgi:hypothetical protein
MPATPAVKEDEATVTCNHIPVYDGKGIFFENPDKEEALYQPMTSLVESIAAFFIAADPSADNAWPVARTLDELGGEDTNQEAVLLQRRWYDTGSRQFDAPGGGDPVHGPDLGLCIIPAN